MNKMMNSNKELKFYVFENYLNRYNVLIAAKDVKTYCFGINNFNLLAFGHNLQTKYKLLKNYVINKLLTNGVYHYITRNRSGKVYY